MSKVRNAICNFIHSQEKTNKLFERLGEKTHNPFTEGFAVFGQSLFTRSFDSRLGNYLEKLAICIIKAQGLNTFQDKAVDLCFQRDGIWHLIELKAGGNLDSKKAKSENNLYVN